MKRKTLLLTLALSAGLLLVPATPTMGANATVITKCANPGCDSVDRGTLKDILSNCKNINAKTAQKILKQCSAQSHGSIDTGSLKQILKKCNSIDSRTLKEILSQCKGAPNPESPGNATTNDTQGSETPKDNPASNGTPESNSASNGTPDDGPASNGTPDDGPASNGTQKDKGQASEIGVIDTSIQQVLDMVNQARTSAGLSPVALQADLSSAAELRAKEIVRSFSHTRPDGSSCFTALKEAGVSYINAGENIAYGQLSAEQVMEGWMNSSGHRANILSPKFHKIGIGHYQKGGVHYWTQMFTN